MSTPLASPSPPASPRNWIRRLAVEGGYLDAFGLPLSPRSNVVCGQPGSGKSTALAFLRYVLMLPVPDHRREEFEELIKTNLGAGRVHIEIELAHGMVYGLSRAGDEAESRIDSPKSAQGMDAKRLIAESFPIRFAGQGELERMATDGLARLDLIARFVHEDWERLRGELVRVRGELDGNGVQLVQIDQEIATLGKACAPLAAQRARLEELKKAAGGDPLPLDAAHHRKALRERERLMMEATGRELDWVKTAVGALASEARRRLGHVVDTEAAAGPNADLLADVATHVQRTAWLIEDMAGRLLEHHTKGAALLEGRSRALAERHAVDNDAYRVLLAGHEGNTTRAFERLTLEKSVAELARAEADRSARVTERVRVAAARDVLRGKLRALLRERTDLLDATAKRLTSALEERVRVEIEPEAERSAYRKHLGELVKSKRFESAPLDAVVAAIAPDDLCAQVLRGDATVLEEVIGSKPIAMRLASVLLESPRLYTLESVELSDVPTISLKHGGRYKPSPQLSSGQRTVAFMSLLLLDKRGPLVADQPEDHVANRYLAEYLCDVFAQVQEDAQLLFVTHNGNIPILGKVVRLFEMEADGERGWLASGGETREVLVPMENNFEGGRKAFVKRKDFYGVE